MKISILLILLLSMMLPASSTIYSVSSNYEVRTTRDYHELAYANYEAYMYEKGWNYLHIYANAQIGLLDQHRGAGFIEGYITYREIYSAYQNLVGSILKGSEALSTQAQNFIDQQLEYMEKMIETHPRDLFWQHAEAYLQQLKFMYRGYITRINVEGTSSLYIGFKQFYYLTNVGDLEDLIPAFHDKSQMGSFVQKNHNQETIKKNLREEKGGNCNGFIKLINGQLYYGHSTHNIYPFLLRIFKTYHFPSRDVNVGSQWFAFSSRPGDLISKDDFYVLSSGLVVMQTSLSNQINQNYADLSPNTVPCWLRATIAANLAKNSTQWVQYFLKARSGTHNNQWLVADPNILAQGKFQNVIILVEQGFSEYSVVDMTGQLKNKDYVASYNIPYTKKIFDKLGYESYPYTYDNEPRAIQYNKYNSMLKNTQSMKQWLIYNDNDNPSIGLAPRADLAQKNPIAFGLTDCKILTPETLLGNYIWAISGPSTSNGKYPVFDWNNWPNVPHQGLPKVWNFTWEKYQIFAPQSIKLSQDKDRFDQYIKQQ